MADVRSRGSRLPQGGSTRLAPQGTEALLKGEASAGGRWRVGLGTNKMCPDPAAWARTSWVFKYAHIRVT
eukprot:1662162-Rhodomonas_salina.1